MNHSLKGSKRFSVARKLVIISVWLLAVCSQVAATTVLSSWESGGFDAAGNYLAVYFDPFQPGVVYAASDVAGLFRSVDDGDNWQMRGIGLGNREVSSFAIDPFEPNRLYAGVGALASSGKAGIYVSEDAGLTWQHLPSTFTNQITFRKYRTVKTIAPDPAEQGVILSGSRKGGIWRTTDAGVIWTQVYAPPVINVVPFSDGTVEDDTTSEDYPAPISVVCFDQTNLDIVYAGVVG